MPADHGEKLHDVPDEDLKEVMVVAKKIAVAQGLVDYNILQVSILNVHALLLAWPTPDLSSPSISHHYLLRPTLPPGLSLTVFPL